MISMSPAVPSAEERSKDLDASESNDTQSSATEIISQSFDAQSITVTSFQSTASVIVHCSNVEPNSQGIQSSQSSSISAGYIANRRIFTARAEEDEEPLPSTSQPETKPVPQARSLTRSSSSYLRLSLTDDGQAKIVDRGVSSPQLSQEPIVSIQPRHAGLRRSYSAAGFNEKPKALGTCDSSRKVPRMSGRSRDSRMWEFWCDSDARNSLIERADQETSGSAAEAIGMIRSKSSHALQLNPNKMNSPIPGHSTMDSGERARPRLKKSLTHVGIIRSDSKEKSTNAKKVDYVDDFEHLNEESDKENLDPVPRIDSRAGPFIHQTKKVVGEHTLAKIQSSTRNGQVSRERLAKDRSNSKDFGSHVDSKVTTFMASSNKSTASPPREEDLHCIEGLLSLSQGKWC
jgi:hypothetical protein